MPQQRPNLNARPSCQLQQGRPAAALAFLPVLRTARDAGVFLGVVLATFLAADSKQHTHTEESQQKSGQAGSGLTLHNTYLCSTQAMFSALSRTQ